MSSPLEPSQTQLRALWDRVVKYRDRHELTCPESIYQMDKPQEDAPDLAADLVEIVGYLPGEEDDE